MVLLSIRCEGMGNLGLESRVPNHNPVYNSYGECFAHKVSIGLALISGCIVIVIVHSGQACDRIAKSWMTVPITLKEWRTVVKNIDVKPDRTAEWIKRSVTLTLPKTTYSPGPIGVEPEEFRGLNSEMQGLCIFGRWIRISHLRKDPDRA